MTHLKITSGHNRLVPTLVLVAVVLLATWMGAVNGGYYVGEWGLVVLILATLALFASIAGMFHYTTSRWSMLALGLFGAYTAWTFASLLWSPNQGDAWLGAGQTLLYLLAFWLATGSISLGASRRSVLAAKRRRRRGRPRPKYAPAHGADRGFLPARPARRRAERL